MLQSWKNPKGESQIIVQYPVVGTVYSFVYWIWKIWKGYMIETNWIPKPVYMYILSIQTTSVRIYIPGCLLIPSAKFLLMYYILIT